MLSKFVCMFLCYKLTGRRISSDGPFIFLQSSARRKASKDSLRRKNYEISTLKKELCSKEQSLYDTENRLYMIENTVVSISNTEFNLIRQKPEMQPDYNVHKISSPNLSTEYIYIFRSFLIRESHSDKSKILCIACKCMI